uniref:ATP synthase subunit a n=1 Tax=Promethichthys prometheus TaxID=349644 RepID=T2HU10_9SCOM|nr:ATP synthase F0 subunit 6 [Promethichthys prometheus]BAN83495.1 ATPase subunit 6 [Promethichthys prometheus]
MAVGFFQQFAAPLFMGTPLGLLALVVPWLLLPPPSYRWANTRTTTSQNWSIVGFVYELLIPINVPGHKWALLLVSLMMFLLSLNMLGLLSYTFTPTTQLSLNMSLAFPLWLSTVIIGMYGQTNIALSHFLPEGTPTPLIPVLIIIETISLFIRPMALGVRLTANITAGHLMIQLISTAAANIMPHLPTLAVLSTSFLVVMTLLEVAVAMIQAYVFILLLSLYLQENT